MVMVVAASVAVVVARGGGGGGGCLRRAELHEQRAEVVVQRHTLGVGVGLLLAGRAQERQRARTRERLLLPPPSPVAAPRHVERRAARHRWHPPWRLRRQRRLRWCRYRVRAVRALARVAPVQPAARARLADARRLRVPELAKGGEARGRGRVAQCGRAEARVLERGLHGGAGARGRCEGAYVANGSAHACSVAAAAHARACTVWHGVRLQHRDGALVEARGAFRVCEAQQEQQVAALHRRALRRRRRRRALLRPLEGRGERGERARGGLAVGRHGEAREGARDALEVGRPQAERGRQLAQLQLPLALQLVGRQAPLALEQQRAPHALRLRHARHGAAQHRQLLGGDRALPPRAAHRAAQLARRLVPRQPQPRRLPPPPTARAQAVYPP